MPKKKILFVDDETDLVAPTKFILEQAGYEVHTASDGKQGLERFEAIRPDLVLLDVMMPKLNGLEVLRILRTNVPGGDTVPVIIYSVKKDEQTFREAHQHGASEYVVKSASSQELLEKIGRLLSGS